MNNKQFCCCIVANSFLLAIVVFLLIRQIPSGVHLVEEGGLIESITVWLYALCIVFIVYKGRLVFLMKFHYIFILIVFFMLRELDFDKQFTSMGILKSQFLLSSQVPLGEKLIGGTVILLLMYCILKTVFVHGGQFYADLKSRSPNCLGLAVIGMLLIVSKSLDGALRKLKSIGVEIDSSMSNKLTVLEEVMEMWIPIIIFLSLTHYFHRPKKLKTSQVIDHS